MQSIIEIQEEIVETFKLFDDWVQKYEYIIELGKELAPIKKEHKIEENIIKGCQSRVWINAVAKEGRVFFDIVYNAQKKRIFNALKKSSSDSVIKFKDVLKKIIDGK